MSIRGWFAESLSDGLIEFANEKHFSEIIIEINKSIQKNYHYLTGHRQSIEYDAIAQNKLLYFKSTHNIVRKIDTKVLKTSKREEIHEKLLKLKIAQDKHVWNTVFVHQNIKQISFNKKGQLDFKYLIASVNYGYKNFENHFKQLYITNYDIESIEEN